MQATAKEPFDLAAHGPANYFSSCAITVPWTREKSQAARSGHTEALRNFDSNSFLKGTTRASKFKRNDAKKESNVYCSQSQLHASILNERANTPPVSCFLLFRDSVLQGRQVVQFVSRPYLHTESHFNGSHQQLLVQQQIAQHRTGPVNQCNWVCLSIASIEARHPILARDVHWWNMMGNASLVPVFDIRRLPNNCIQTVYGDHDCEACMIGKERSN